MTITNQFFYYLLLWILFGIIHSVLSMKAVKTFIPFTGKWYRLFYNIVVTITFILVILNVPSLSLIFTELININLVYLISFILFFLIGISILFIGALAWDISAFLGLKEEISSLQIDGIYAFSRHPVYTGILLILVSLLFIEISDATLSWLLGAGGYFVLGTIPEEHKLKQNYKIYTAYKQKVGRFFPYRLIHFRYLIDKNKNEYFY
jgi:methanethiol S-methyltransferase